MGKQNGQGIIPNPCFLLFGLMLLCHHGFGNAYKSQNSLLVSKKNKRKKDKINRGEKRIRKEYRNSPLISSKRVIDR